MSRKHPPKLEAILTQKPKDLEQGGDEDHEVPSLKEWVPPSPVLFTRYLCSLYSSQLALPLPVLPGGPDMLKSPQTLGAADPLVSRGCYMAREVSAPSTYQQISRLLL